MDDADLIKKGLEELGLSYSQKQIDAFRIYLAELKKWGRAYNLTGLKTDSDIITKHFLDSLLFLKVIPTSIQTIADIGSGAGFPGVPIKILNPPLKIFLVEPTQKKAIFLRHICSTLGLADMVILQSRIEDIEGIKVDVAITRALFSVGEFIEKAKKILNEHGILILNKGPKLNEELKGLDQKNITVRDLTLPFEHIIRHMVVVRT